MIKKIISGGQTGVDRAALDAALIIGIRCGGWCPFGRMAADGMIDQKYPLIAVELDHGNEIENYQERTLRNIRDADGTLIIKSNQNIVINDGTVFTEKKAVKLAKPLMVIYLDDDKKNNIACIQKWLKDLQIEVLNVAGPREASDPGIYQRTFNFLKVELSPFIEK